MLTVYRIFSDSVHIRNYFLPNGGHPTDTFYPPTVIYQRKGT